MKYEYDASSENDGDIIDAAAPKYPIPLGLRVAINAAGEHVLVPKHGSYCIRLFGDGGYVVGDGADDD